MAIKPHYVSLVAQDVVLGRSVLAGEPGNVVLLHTGLSIFRQQKYRSQKYSTSRIIFSIIAADSITPSAEIYARRDSPLHSGWLHWQLSSVTFFRSLQPSQQYGLPSAGTQLHPACLHFFWLSISVSSLATLMPVSNSKPSSINLCGNAMCSRFTAALADPVDAFPHSNVHRKHGNSYRITIPEQPI